MPRITFSRIYNSSYQWPLAAEKKLEAQVAEERSCTVRCLRSSLWGLRNLTFVSGNPKGQAVKKGGGDEKKG
jgi:hypothetical protein